ncbi:hypothetical protein DV735_g2670, partial [Chaetothyriales sp. CBS 134920]
MSPPESTATADWRSVVGHLTPKKAKSVRSMGHSSRSKEAAHFNQPNPARAPAGNYNPMYTTDPTCVKVNIWKPKAGTKYWFDGLDDSSEDEDFEEPEFRQNLVLGIESDFRNDQIGAPSSGKQSHLPIRATGHDITPRDGTGLIAGKASNRVAVLNAKASRSNLPSALAPQSQLQPLGQHNLSENSVLDLSSDEDDLLGLEKMGSRSSHHGLRDSVGLDSNIDSSDELSTARTINVISRMKPVEVVRIRRPPAIPPAAREQSQMLIPKRGSSLPLTHRHDSAESKDDSSDLIAAFPLTPVESVAAPSLNTSIRSSSAFPLTPVGSVAPSFNTSIRSSVALSSTGSVESRRLMSVTRQEESLLAAMRLKKAAMKYNTSQVKRSSAATKTVESGQSPAPSRTLTRFPSVPQLYYRSPPTPGSDLTPRRHCPPSLVEDGSSAVAGEKKDPTPGRLSFSSSTHSAQHSATPSLPSSTADQRQSRDTNFSLPMANERTTASGHHRTLTVNSHVVALDDLDQAPKRDQIPSQEFIDWPYKGWETRLELGLAR